ncbi:MAG: hypothetical protein ACN4GK_02085 [Acidimicrobiia bacterium]
MEPETGLSPRQVRAEWIRAWSFLVAAVGLLVMALAHFENDTGWWLAGLGGAVIGVAGLLGSAFVLEPARAIFRSLARLKLADATEALIQLNRIPPMGAPHRTPRIVATMFGALSGAAGLLVIARLLTM